MAVENSILQMLQLLPKIMYLTYPAPFKFLAVAVVQEPAFRQILMLPEPLLLQFLNY